MFNISFDKIGNLIIDGSHRLIILRIRVEYLYYVVKVPHEYYNLCITFPATLGAVTVGLLPVEMWLPPGSENMPENSTTMLTLPFTGIEVILRIQAFFGIGVVCGALLASVSLQLIGQRSSMVLYDVVLTYSLAIYVWPGEALWLAIGNRICMGIAVGALSAIIPNYVCEMSHHKLKSISSVLLFRRCNAVSGEFIVLRLNGLQTVHTTSLFPGCNAVVCYTGQGGRGMIFFFIRDK